MRFCLFEPADGGTAPRLGLLQGDAVVDVHGACMMSMTDHLSPKRAREIATALCPPDLVGFLENGQHAWNALEDSFRRLDGRLRDASLVTPGGEPVVRPLRDVRVVPVVPRQARYDGGDGGAWRAVTVPGTPATLHTDGRPYLPEYLAVIGTAADGVDAEDAWSVVALVSEARPTDASDATVLRTPAELTDDDHVLRTTVAAAVAEASRHRVLLVGDIVRTGLRLGAPGVDVDLVADENLAGERQPAH